MYKHTKEGREKVYVSHGGNKFVVISRVCVGGVYVQKVDAEKLDNSEQRHKQQNRRQKENVPSFKTQKFIGNYKNYGIKPVDIKAVVSSRAENHRRKSSGICL